VTFWRVDLAAETSSASPEGLVPVDWHPDLAALRGALPVGEQRFWTIPFAIADPWLEIDGSPMTIVIDGTATHLIVAHFCDSAAASGPSDRTVGQMMAIGEHIADYVIAYADGGEQRLPVRRRYEIGEFAISWGHMPFAARPHRADMVPDPGASITQPWFGQHQTGVVQGAYEAIGHMTSPATWWIHALENPDPGRRLASLRIEPVGNVAIALGGLTLFEGTAHPLQYRPARVYRLPLEGPRDPAAVDVAVELGLLGARVTLDPPAATTPRGDAFSSAQNGVPPRRDPDGPQDFVAHEISATADATVTVEGRVFPVGELEVIGESRVPLRFRVLDAETGDPLAARVNVRTPEGLRLPPAGHAAEVNVHWFQDWAPDVRAGGLDMAYVDGGFEVSAPPGPLHIVAGHGLEYERFEATVDPAGAPVEIGLRRAFDPGPGWMRVDTHVHFLSPATALLEAEAEDVDLVNLLAAQWGSLFTNVGDLGQGEVLRRGRRSVWMGSENRQHMLGHVLLLGTGADPIFPLSAAGPGESTIGDPVWVALAEWAGQSRSRGGLAIAPHFPGPYAEVVADVVLGLIDGVELRHLGPHRDSVDLEAWYALLNAGYSVPCVGGTDKMWAGTALGAARTYAYVGDKDGDAGFGAFASAVRAGRTLATNGPFIDLRIDGQTPGAVIELPAGGGTVDASVAVASVVPVDGVEIVKDGRVIVDGDGASPLSASIELTEGGWIAARAYGSRLALSAAWKGNVAAHTSPVYVRVAGQRRRDERAMEHLDAVMVGALIWLDTLATRASDERHGAIKDVFRRARSQLRRGPDQE